MKNFSYLIDIYKESKKDQHLFSYSQSVHWEKYFKENDKFYNLNNLINFRKNQILSA